MIKVERFAVSRSLYAVDLSSLCSRFERTLWEGEPPPGSPEGLWRNSMRAAWFRRRDGVTVSCVGELRFFSSHEVPNATEFLRRHTDGRCGGDTAGRWNGWNYWGPNSSLDEQAEHLALLRPMLEAFPAVPPGFDGWWGFR